MADACTEPFLLRWSRLKRKARQSPPERTGASETNSSPQAPQLPPLEQLGFDSDYRAFFDARVDEETRRAALKKLFGDPHFNKMDGLDVYIGDYRNGEPISAAMLARLTQAQQVLAWAAEPSGRDALSAPPPLPGDQ